MKYQVLFSLKNNENIFKTQGSYRNRKSKFQDFSRTFQGLFTFFPGVISHRQ